MLNSAEARTNIELAVECKEHSFLNSTALIPPVPYLSQKQTGKFVKAIYLLSWVK